MTYASERSAIESLFATGWVTGSPSTPLTPIGFDGQTFTPVKNSVRLTILNGDSRQGSVGTPGSNLARYAGVVALQVFTEGGKGTAASRAYEDAISDIFRNKTTGAIRFGVPYVSGSLEEPPFLVRTVMVPFSRDEFHG